MNKLNRYDTWLWRLNGSLLLLAVIFGLILLTMTFSALRQTGDRRSDVETEVEATKTGTERKRTLQLAQGLELRGTGYVVLTLREGEPPSGSYSLGEQARGANFLLLGAEPGGTWVLPKNTPDRASYETVGENLEDGAKVIGLMITTAYGKGPGDSDAKFEVNYYDLATRSLTTLLPKVDRLIGVFRTGRDESTVVFSREGRAFRKRLKLSTRSVSTEEALPAPPF